MFLKCRERRKDGKIHRNWSIVESRRYANGQVAHRHVLYLGELNDTHREAWQRTLEVIDERTGETHQMALFPADRAVPATAAQIEALQVRLDRLALRRPRQWGACWLGDHLWRLLRLDAFFAPRLGHSREGTDWEKVLRVLTLYRLISPGSEWRLHRHWFDTTALPDLLGVDARIAQDDTLYRGHDRLLEHKDALFAHLRERWADLFHADYEVLLYDLTSTCFECVVPESPDDPRRFGHSREQARPAPTFASREAHWGQGSALSRPKACPSPTRCCRATPPTRPPCAPCARWCKNATAKPAASG
jgi:hypothetical protein